jgi:DNA-binding transcriptional LysR family regulator
LTAFCSLWLQQICSCGPHDQKGLRSMRLTSVSRHLMALEEVLGTTLVERTTRHLSLTESGLLYYERAKQILEEVAEAERGLTT